jgi:choline dehydrogenase
MASFDYIVVGSGSSGGVVAARLSEGGKYRVACLEAGTKGANYIWTKPPAGVAMMIRNPTVNWRRESQPNATTADRPIYVPGGKLLGGSSAINGMIYNRGQKGDYNTWAQMGCKGWSYEDVLPYFKKIESTEIGDDAFRGRSGPIKVETTRKTSPFYDLFIKSAQAIGLPLNPDYSGAAQYGVAMAQQTVHRGFRQSVATQYLAPASKRPNLAIIQGAEAASLIMEGQRCVGVRYRRNGAMEEVRASREVIVSSGAAGSPKLLELSGIGNPEILARHGIEVIHALPGVGENLRDHYGPMLQWTFKQRGISLAEKGRGWKLLLEIARYGLLRSGFIAQGLATMRVFTRSHDGIEDANIALLVNPHLVEYGPKRWMMSPIDGFYISAQVQRPESCGSIHIKSADPFADPAINYNFLATENDRHTAIMAFRRAREIVQTAPLSETIDREILPGPQVQSDVEILDFIRTNGGTTFHPVGTCKMGHDAMSVVDDRLRVHGVQGLRVADASIMPTMISGNTSIPCMMIGERCADMIQADA